MRPKRSAITSTRARDSRRMWRLLRAVEVDDRHERGAERGHAVERLRRLDPVRQLERDAVAGPDAEALEPAGDA